jgi:hypothetical protein
LAHERPATDEGESTVDRARRLVRSTGVSRIAAVALVLAAAGCGTITGTVLPGSDDPGAQSGHITVEGGALAGPIVFACTAPTSAVFVATPSPFVDKSHCDLADQAYADASGSYSLVVDTPGDYNLLAFTGIETSTGEVLRAIAAPTIHVDLGHSRTCNFTFSVTKSSVSCLADHG